MKKIVITLPIHWVENEICRIDRRHSDISLTLTPRYSKGSFAVCAVKLEACGTNPTTILSGEDQGETCNGIDEHFFEPAVEAEFWGIQLSEPRNFLRLSKALREKGLLVATEKEMDRWLKQASVEALDAAFAPSDDVSGRALEQENTLVAGWNITDCDGGVWKFNAYVKENERIDTKPQGEFLLDIFGRRLLMRKF